MATIVMTAELRVEYTVVISKSNDMQDNKGRMEQTMERIDQIITGLKPVWEGQASELFQAKYTVLHTSIERMLRVAQEYSTDLGEIAETYRSAEERARGEADRLRSENVFEI